MFIGCSQPHLSFASEFVVKAFNADTEGTKLLRNESVFMVGRNGVSYPIDIAGNGKWAALIVGNPSWREPDFALLAEERGHGFAVGQVFEQQGMALLKYLSGVFAISLYDLEGGILHLATDHFGIIPIYFTRPSNGGVVWGSSARILRLIPSLKFEVSYQAIFHYLYFHMIPSPASIFSGIEKLRPGEVVTVDNQAMTRYRYWSPQFLELENDRMSLALNVRQSLEESVKQFSGENPGTFLSGGLDSSTVTGLLAKIREGDVDAYSIGFSAPGYDEMDFARIVAKYYGVRHHEYYVTPEDVVDVVPRIVAAYDEPFGNSSVVPTYLCSKMAKENGTLTLLAGDGGDELFAGNTRYLKQKKFEYYHRLPSEIRKAIEIAQRREFFVHRVPRLKKIYRYIAQANVPLPDRLQTYNIFESQPLPQLLAENMLKLIDPQISKELLREEFELEKSASTLNRMLRLDWRFVLADNDLRKVGAMTRLAGVKVHYPMLVESVVEIANKIPSHLKIFHHTIRYFYKNAFKNFLPAKVLSKSKHGFGMPFGVWMLTHPGLHAMAYDAIVGLKKRDLLASAYLDKLLDQHRHEHAAYYGEIIWVLMMLEYWFQNEENAHAYGM